jgi:hypothetical protein
MTKAIDRTLRRELISQAAERLWQRQGVRPGGHVPRGACPTCGAWHGGRAAPSRPPGADLAAPR